MGTMPAVRGNNDALILLGALFLLIGLGNDGAMFTVGLLFLVLGVLRRYSYYMPT